MCLFLGSLYCLCTNATVGVNENEHFDTYRRQKHLNSRSENSEHDVKCIFYFIRVDLTVNESVTGSGTNFQPGLNKYEKCLFTFLTGLSFL